MMNRHSVHMDEAAKANILNSFTLALFKGAVGWLGGSKALLTDALLSAGEAVQGLSRLMLLRSDKRTSTGTAWHSKDKQGDNSLLLIVILFLILVWGAAEAIAVSVKSLMDAAAAAPHYMAGMAAILSICIKEAGYQTRARHNVLEEDKNRLLAQHRLSLVTSLIVLAGVIGAMTGDLLNNRFLLNLDPIAAIITAVIFLWKASQMLYKVSSAGSAARKVPAQDSIQVLDTIQRVYGVITVEELEIHERTLKPYVYVRIGVSPRISMQEAAEISERVKFLLLSRFSHFQNVEVRAIPYEPGYPYKSNYEDKDSNETLLQ